MSIRILVVDDNRDTLRTYIKALLRWFNAKEWNRRVPEAPTIMLDIEEADTVAVARKKLHEQIFDILVVDLKILGSSGEEMGGLSLISEAIQLDPLRPIIVITGYGTIDLARRTLTQGVFDFIEKSSTAVEELINAIQKAIDARDEKIRRAGNPFTPMTGVEPTIFGGRAKELEFFEQRLHRAIHSRFCEHFLILGDWGIGKSTLLREYKKICQSRGYLATIVPLEPLQAGTSLIDAARSIVEGIIRDLPYTMDRFKKLVGFFDSIGISVLGTGLQFKRDTSKRDHSTQAFLHDTLTMLWQDVKSNTDILVILLDDLDNFLAVPEIIMTLKQTLSMDAIEKSKILVGIASPLRSWVEIASIDRHHPLSRYFMSRMELGPLSEDELQDTIIKSLSGTGVSCNIDVIKHIFKYTNGHPFEMQVLCHHLFNHQLSRHVGMDVWEKSLQSSLKDIGTAIFEHWFSQASGEETKVLRVIADRENPLSVKEILEKMAMQNVKISPKNIAKYLQRLMEKRLISKEGRGVYNIPDQMFRAYIHTHCE